jgi:hypothetical protein
VSDLSPEDIKYLKRLRFQLESVERRYALRKIAAGDYLLLSNDRQTLWRLNRYQDGPSYGLEDMPRDRWFWRVFAGQSVSARTRAWTSSMWKISRAGARSRRCLTPAGRRSTTPLTREAVPDER